jgi:hypothetical protein
MKYLFLVIILALMLSACNLQTESDNNDWWRYDNGASVSFSWGYDISTPDFPMGVLNENGPLVRTTHIDLTK